MIGRMQATSLQERSSDRRELKRELGVVMTALVVGNMTGSGIFLLPASLAAVALVSGSSSLLAWGLTGVGAMLLAEVYLFITDRARLQIGRLTREVIVAVLAFAYSVWAMLGAGSEVIAKGYILLLVGVPVYVWLRWWRSHERVLELPPAPGVGDGEDPIQLESPVVRFEGAER